MLTSLAMSFVDPSRGTSNIRAVDWIDLLLVVYPTIVAERMDEQPAYDALCQLVYACSLALQWRIKEEDLQAIDR